MPEKYIKAADCEKYFYEHLDDVHIAAAMNAIDEMPAADVAPVRHGRWNKWNYAPNRKAIFLDSVCEQYKTLGYPHRIILAFQCSECNMVSMVDKSHGKYDFCPNCGAKMDEEEKSDV